MRRIVGGFFCLWIWLSFPTISQALWVPSIMLGGNAILNPKTDNIPGARGSLTQIEWGWLWEQEKSEVAWGLFLPVETDFGSRVAFGPRVALELWGSLRIFTAAMVEFGQPYSFFFVRGGLALGWRNTGKRPSPPLFPVQGGVAFWVALDYRIANPNQMLPQNIRLLWGLRIELGLEHNKGDQ